LARSLGFARYEGGHFFRRKNQIARHEEKFLRFIELEHRAFVTMMEVRLGIFRPQRVLSKTKVGAVPMTAMSFHVPETAASTPQQQPNPSRRHATADEYLILSELNPGAVIDHLDEDAPMNLVTFGNVREVCPKCAHRRLQLVLRQATVRIAHLFCADCESCFDAHYPNGSPALTI
jgi:hypothetical protein